MAQKQQKGFLRPLPDRQEAPLSWLDRVASRALQLLRESDNPQQEMKWAVRQLEENSLYSGNPPSKNLVLWTEQVIAQNPDLTDQSLPWIKERGIYPEKAETFESLILSLIPKEGGP